MEGSEGLLMGFETKSCPRCGAELYADMCVCYECLYDFSRERQREVRAQDVPTIGGKDVGAGASPLERRVVTEVGVLVQTPVVDVWTAVSSGGATIGRGVENNVVLHSPAVSERHLRVVPTPDGMEVCDLGSNNPARYRGRDIRDRVVVSYGDTIDICGCRLTMTGPVSFEPPLD